MATEVITPTASPTIDYTKGEDHDNSGIIVSEERASIVESQSPENWTRHNADPKVPSGQNQQKKHHHRRKPSKKKRKWKPYSKMTWEERKALEEKEKSKAVRIREEMKEKGRPVAPYNTTQFLMEEHDPYDNSSFEPSGYNNSSVTGTEDGESYSDDQDDMNGSLVSKEDDDNDAEGDETIEGYTDSPHMVPEFISQDFSETYERVHEENLQTMSRDELLSEHMDLEKKFNILQEQLAKRSSKIRALEAKIKEVERENEKLNSANESLVSENEILKGISSKPESRMSTSDTEENGSKDTKKLEAPFDGEVMERS
uniref:protein HEXIM1-like n=1 Tax=Styela clava TaxID=7725 RepID=UPI001939EDFC|nr:protein HEXIM1-like [Styela clava]XP_039268270.1 protein HEXIM1-like [Styela clava]